MPRATRPSLWGGPDPRAQAVQTNGAQLDTKLKDALSITERIDALNTNAFAIAAPLVIAYTGYCETNNSPTDAISDRLALP